MQYEEVEVNSERWFDLTPLLNEEFRDIEGFEEYYQVSNYGRIKSLERKINAGIKHSNQRTTKEKILKIQKTYDNYYSVTLSKNHKSKKYRLHQIIALAFIPNPNNYFIINHIDNNGLNNKIENLEWCTQSYNVKYAYQKGNAIPQNTRKVNQLTKNMEIIASFESLSDAVRSIGVNRTSNITKCCKKEIPTAYGYVWRYVDE